jgi:hypothetical protein
MISQACGIYEMRCTVFCCLLLGYTSSPCDRPTIEVACQDAIQNERRPVKDPVCMQEHTYIFYYLMIDMNTRVVCFMSQVVRLAMEWLI